MTSKIETKAQLEKEALLAGANTLGERLRLLRVEAGLSQSGLAGQLGVAASTAAMYERNERPMPGELIERAAGLFGVTPAALRLGVTHSGPRWYVCQAQPGQEKVALENLRNQRFETYLPMVMVEVKAQGGRPARIVGQPLFPRYVFVRLGVEAAHWRAVFSTRGVQSVLCSTQGRPAPVPEWMIERTRKLEAEGFGGFDLQETRQATAAFERGEAVKVDALISGVFHEKVDERRSMILVMLLKDESHLVEIDTVRLSKSPPRAA